MKKKPPVKYHKSGEMSQNENKFVSWKCAREQYQSKYQNPPLPRALSTHRSSRSLRRPKTAPFGATAPLWAAKESLGRQRQRAKPTFQCAGSPRPIW